MEKSVGRAPARSRAVTVAGLAAVALAAIVWIAPVNVVFFTARDRSQRYTAMGAARFSLEDD